MCYYCYERRSECAVLMLLTGIKDDGDRAFILSLYQDYYGLVRKKIMDIIVARLSRQSSWAKLMNHILPFDGCNYAAIPSNTG